VTLTPFQGTPGPERNPETAPFWDAARDGRFLLPRCASCHRWHWYPRAFCPFCHGGIGWHEASGRGTLYSFTLLQGPRGPYALAYVTLEEGPTMLTNIVAGAAEDLRIGMPVALTLVPCDNGEKLPVFRPRTEAAR
jgi:uncharacterized OB-fold protein